MTLLDNSTYINATDNYDYTPLMWTIKTGVIKDVNIRKDIIIVLLK